MNLAQKIIFTIVSIVLLGLIVTGLYEKGGVAPGDGTISFILFIIFIVIIIFIWRSKPKKPETDK
jgi:membrane protease YdiL (CAAX protease family)